MESFKKFFQRLNILPTKTLLLTKSVLDERNYLNATIDGLQPRIQQKLFKMEELRKVNEKIRELKDTINDGKKFQI